MKLKAVFVAAALILSGIAMNGLDRVHPFGNPENAGMDDYILAHALKDRSSENIVTSVVFDYRGFDALGEAAVLFGALCSVVMLFRKGGN